MLERLGRRSAPAGEQGAVKAAQELLGFMLNAEFVLFEAYREHGLRVNPSLAHWIEVCQGFETLGQNNNPRGELGVREKVLRIRVAFVKGILGDHGSKVCVLVLAIVGLVGGRYGVGLTRVKLADITPHDFALRRLDFMVDIDSFKGALQEQGIYEEASHGTALDDRRSSPVAGGFPTPIGAPAKSYQNTENSNVDGAVAGSGYSSASGITSGAQSPSPISPDLQAELSAYLIRAGTEELRPNVTSSILNTLKSSPSLLSLFPLDFISASTLSNLVSCNPILARGVVMLLLHQQQQQQGSTSQRRSEILTALAGIPASLNALETLNILITQTQLLTKDETSRLVHEFLANAIHATETMGGSTSSFTAGNRTPEYHQGGGVGTGVGTGKRAQNRQVQLLCLFVQSLLRAGGVDVADVYYGVQELGVRFMYVKEARELWKLICG